MLSFINLCFNWQGYVFIFPMMLSWDHRVINWERTLWNYVGGCKCSRVSLVTIHEVCFSASGCLRQLFSLNMFLQNFSHDHNILRDESWTLHSRTLPERILRRPLFLRRLGWVASSSPASFWIRGPPDKISKLQLETLKSAKGVTSFYLADDHVTTCLRPQKQRRSCVGLCSDVVAPAVVWFWNIHRV